MSVDRFLNAPTSGKGTPESQWAAADLRFPEFSLDGCERLVIIAPHPDDEVLGVGGIATSAAERGIETHAVIVTDGQSSHPGSPTYTPNQLAALRRIESARANATLGLRKPVHLGFTDGQVETSEKTLARALKQYVDNSWVLVTWAGDGHPDHEACARATRLACADTGSRVLEYPIWMWHWALPQDTDVPWGRARRFDLSTTSAARKADAVNAFTTQIRPLSEHPADAAVLPSHVLERLLRPYEVVLISEDDGK
ncbi:LmbE family N-acetylglucosaminyl deacetylase [Antricoccus suffuscus]|uniref:LmbE family N-acetylglucosaminyl deacetylase n=1 Tax=Antricoccus suffuscus TaxID=1629062 RepID=A0A2T1A192_9ACTN|nr:PIG-L deacetylase family protein [Antricoccus suffuscus]PRZ42257.1 LmbE family N-acetylglucosaminyl deacetylase [Antricoccus suffuscus]